VFYYTYLRLLETFSRLRAVGVCRGLFGRPADQGQGSRGRLLTNRLSIPDMKAQTPKCDIKPQWEIPHLIAGDNCIENADILAGCQRLTPVILATLEAEARRIPIRGQQDK
jgi:hypothetical protein